MKLKLIDVLSAQIELRALGDLKDLQTKLSIIDVMRPLNDAHKVAADMVTAAEPEERVALERKLLAEEIEIDVKKLVISRQLAGETSATVDHLGHLIAVGLLKVVP
jgi:hypothetical protein